MPLSLKTRQAISQAQRLGIAIRRETPDHQTWPEPYNPQKPRGSYQRRLFVSPKKKLTYAESNKRRNPRARKLLTDTPQHNPC